MATATPVPFIGIHRVTNQSSHVLHGSKPLSLEDSGTLLVPPLFPISGPYVLLPESPAALVTSVVEMTFSAMRLFSISTTIISGLIYVFSILLSNYFFTVNNIDALWQTAHIVRNFLTVEIIDTCCYAECVEHIWVNIHHVYRCYHIVVIIARIVYLERYTVYLAA